MLPPSRRAGGWEGENVRVCGVMNVAVSFHLSEYERQALTYIAEDMAGLVFDDSVLERFQELGLAERRVGSWSLTEAGRANLPRVERKALVAQMVHP